MKLTFYIFLICNSHHLTERNFSETIFEFSFPRNPSFSQFPSSAYFLAGLRPAFLPRGSNGIEVNSLSSFIYDTQEVGVSM